MTYKQEYDRRYYLQHKEEIKERSRNRARTHVEENRHRVLEWQKTNRERVNLKNRIWKNAHKEQRRHSHRRYRYNLTETEFNMLLRVQDDKCAVCGESFGMRGPQIDHDHGTGRVRGLLCIHCNGMLGLAKDDPERLMKGITYLKAKAP